MKKLSLGTASLVVGISTLLANGGAWQTLEDCAERLFREQSSQSGLETWQKGASAKFLLHARREKNRSPGDH